MVVASPTASRAEEDQALFSIDPNTGELSFISAPDFMTPTDADGNNDYEVEVTVTDGAGATDVQTLTVNVTDVNGNPPDITSDGGGLTATVSVQENTTAVTNVESIDLDGETENGGGPHLQPHGWSRPIAL